MPLPDPGNPPVVNPNAYDNQVALSTIRAAGAYTKIEGSLGVDTVPGTGITIGVLDSGIDEGHEAFTGKTIRETRLGGARNEDGSRFSHGTAVASVAAAVAGFSSDSIQGVAPGADLVSIAIPLGSPPTQYSVVSLDALNSANRRWRAYYDHALDQNLDILNLSVGFNGIIENYTEEEIRANFAESLASMAQAGSNDPVLTVWAAGNANGRRCDLGIPNCRADGTIEASSAEILSGLMVRIPELRGHTVTVVATNEGGNIASFSNRCGIAADYCIAAPGTNITIAYFGPRNNQNGQRGYRRGNGTSYAAPMISGGLALIMQRFRDQLSSTEVLTRLFDTANKQGTYSNREVYGQGLMDLDAATASIGASSVILGQEVHEHGAPLDQTRLLLSPAFGANPLQSLAGREIAAFDSYGAPFWHSLDSLVSARSPSISTQLQSVLSSGERPSTSEASANWNSVILSGDTRLGLAVGESGYRGVSGPSLAMTWGGPESPVELTAFTTEGMERQPPVSGTSIHWRRFGLTTGLLNERASMLGAAAEGGFGRLSASSIFAGLNRRLSFGAWQLEAEAEAGVSNSTASLGMLEGVKPLLASRYKIGVSRIASRDGNSRVRFSLEQPLRVERAQAELVAPVGRTKTGEIVLERWKADLAPAGRQIDLSAWWNTSNGNGRLFGIGAVYSRHPGHDADASPSMSLFARFQLSL